MEDGGIDGEVLKEHLSKVGGVILGGLFRSLFDIFEAAEV